MQQFPFIGKYYRALIEQAMLSIEKFDLTDYELVVSSTVAFAKGVITGPHQLHISYIHSPPRYAWDLTHQYFKKTGLLAPVINEILHRKFHRLRIWDLRTLPSIDHIIVNSHFIAQRVEKFYRRESTVIHPPVDIDRLTFNPDKEDFYITASRLVPYKRVDLIVEAFNKMPDKKLIIIGDGPESAQLRKAANANIEFLGHVSRQDLIKYFGMAKAFIYAALEDFGIVPVEAQACGTPVIAYGLGGIRDSVCPLGGSDSPTGLFFPTQSAASLKEAVTYFEDDIDKFSAESCRNNAEAFSTPRFHKDFTQFVEKSWDGFAAKR